MFCPRMVVIQSDNDFPAYKPVRHGVMVTLDTYSRLFADAVSHGLKASDVARPHTHGGQIGAYAQLLFGGIRERGLTVHLHAYELKMGLRIVKRGDMPSFRAIPRRL